ncbi:MAG: hypothetical protein ACKVIW_13170, partial [bacterium]
PILGPSVVLPSAGRRDHPPGNVACFEHLANPYDSQPRAGCYGLRRLAMTCEGRCREPMPIASDSPFRIALFFCSRSFSTHAPVLLWMFPEKSWRIFTWSPPRE